MWVRVVGDGGWGVDCRACVSEKGIEICVDNREIDNVRG